MADVYIKNIAFKDGGSRAIAGDFLHVRACTHPFHIEITDKQKQQITYEVDAGDQFLPKNGFTEIRVINDLTNESLDAEILYGYGDFKRGAQVISSINNILNPVTIAQSTAEIFTGNILVPSETTKEIFNSNNNVNGVVIHALTLSTSQLAESNLFLVADGLGNGTLLARARVDVNTVSHMSFPMRIGAGVGLSLVASVGDGGAYVAYDFL